MKRLLRVLGFALLAFAGIAALAPESWRIASQSAIRSMFWSFSDTDDMAAQARELEDFIELSGQPRRLVQVDLATHPKVSQFADIDASRSGYGRNACGLVAAAVALGGADWRPLMARIAEAAGDTYKSHAGIQPTNYTAALSQVFGTRHVKAVERGSLGDLYRALAAGRVVIVDIKVNDNTGVPSAQPPNYAHFARVLGMDIDTEEVYIDNTLNGSAYWIVSFADFAAAWHRPETSSSIILDPNGVEDVDRWAVTIDGTLVPAPQTREDPAER